MKKILLSSAIIAAAFVGCGGDGTCCDATPAAETVAPNNIAIAPVATITNLNNATKIQAGQSLTVNGTTSSDRDGTVAEYSWTIDGQPVSTAANPTLTFDTAGDHTVCLTVTDNDALKSQNVECRTLTVEALAVTPTLQGPTAVMTLTNDAAPLVYQSNHTFSCANSHDNDTLGTGAEIVRCDWNIQSYRLDTNGNEIPYRDCSALDTVEHPIHICQRNNVVKVSRIVTTLTVTDNDGQTATTTQEYTQFQ